MSVSALGELREEGRMTWTAREHGWVAVLDEVVAAFARGGFEECKRAATTSRRDLQPAGGVWQGVNHATGSVASAVWVARAAGGAALMFIEIDGKRVDMDDESEFDRRSYRDEGGES